MKKKQRCFIKRFAALVAALMLCASLCVPCFASNNASSRKWKIIAEAQMANESGTESKYFHISPYVNGDLYRTHIITRTASVQPDLNNNYFDYWSYPANYPDWWRSPVPLGSRAYLQIDDPQLISFRYDTKDRSYSSSTANLTFVLFPLSSGFSITKTYESSASSLTGEVFAYPVQVTHMRRNNTGGTSANTGSVSGVNFPSVSTSILRSSVAMAIENFSAYAYNPVGISVGNYILQPEFDLNTISAFYNASSDSLRIGVVDFSKCTRNAYCSMSISCSAVFSYWVGADKLPAGLKVGDEFPADTDAFDSLRDDLIKQFPEAAEKIENGKSTLTGWNDTETVDTDLANTSLSTINALFQNLGQFLAIVSLMIFGAVVLRMLLRKAVDG